MEEDNLIDILTKERINNELEDKLRVASCYLEAVNKQGKACDKLDKMKLTKNQKRAVDQAISAANASGAAYGRIAYNQGFQDGIKLISELKQLF